MTADPWARGASSSGGSSHTPQNISATFRKICDVPQDYGIPVRVEATPALCIFHFQSGDTIAVSWPRA